jgi:hypothetical protein
MGIFAALAFLQFIGYICLVTACRMFTQLKSDSNQYLFSDFLENKKVFNLAEAYWRRMVAAIARARGGSFRPYLNHLGADGRKEYDANPIFEAFFPELDKAVRIIQDRPEQGKMDISGWLDQLECEEGRPPTPELLLALALSRETAKIARQLLHRWIVEDCTPEEMKKDINRYTKGDFRLTLITNNQQP